MKKYYFTGEETALAYYDFEIPEWNENFFIRWVQKTEEEEKIASKGGYECLEFYRTIYYDRETKEIYAYNDYYDEAIEMDETWIEDLINDSLIKEDNNDR